MAGYAQEDASADLESGSPPYSRSDSPSPERPLIDRRSDDDHGNRRDRDGRRHRARNPRRYSDDIERLDGTSQRLRYYSSPSLRVPKKVGHAVSRWVRGPNPPEKQRIKPIFPNIQAIPIRIFDNFCPSRRSKVIAWLVACALWLLAFILVEHYSYFRGKATILACEDTLWSKNSGCGLDGVGCRSFANGSFVFRCPTDCGSARLLEPYTVGTQQLNYQPLVVGGGLPSAGIDAQTRHYRADSFVCLAAAHSGVLQAAKGGCARLRKTGTQASFPSSSSSGLQSVAFDAPFISSFTVERLEESEPCTDLRWTAFGITLAFNIIVSLFTTNPTVFFWSLFCSIFWEVGMASDPPGHTTAYDLVAIASSRFLPTAFAAYVLERFVVRRTLKGLNAQIEKTILWVGACWFGALNNYTFNVWIPISRLTPHDLGQQPGAKAALAVIVIALVVIAVFQALAIRKEGNMIRYLQFYIFCGVCIGLLIAIPNLNLRIHHYILSLLLLPGTRLQTRPSLVYQGLLMGLFINGLAKWGWDGILQTSADLRGDALLGSALPKVEDVVVGLANVTVFWALPKAPWDSISILVNDVEKFRGAGNFVTLERRTVGQIQQQAWYDSPNRGNSSVMSDLLDDNRGLARLFEDEEREKMYIRVGFVSGNSVGSVGDYTKAGTVFANGTWLAMEPGAT
ncbi:hypothetical protein Dda_6122 [Drechslerella dactyloides]|uniref:LCCL domain-containing protein n=1 Tax=Drechslerella dactyloides TaxID=74499 RepID=A0AAD6NI65_DREDA|nr:hypothetical protein Dda_6122 [Drechslerella dactyloides]